jgi:hypothetical protein
MIAVMYVRWIAMVVLLIACRREPPPTRERTGSAASAAAGSAAGGSAASGSGAVDGGGSDAVAEVELLHGVASTVQVSSTVKNRAILPEHLVDGDFKTAWNSVTGELVGAWFEVSVEDGARIRELRMTVGHTGSGSKGEDYFVMNPRIKAVDVVADGKAAGRVKLDVGRRALQIIAVPAAQRVRVVVAEVVPGSKKAWREVSVSELEAWGTPPPGWGPPAKPRVPTVEVAQAAAAANDPCDGIEAERAAFQEAHKNDVYTHPDHSYPPACETVAVTPPRDPAWPHAIQWCDVYDEIYGPTTCHLQLGGEHGADELSLESQHASARIQVLELTTADVVPGGERELVARFGLGGDEYVGVCRASPTVACTAPMQIAASVWRTSFRFQGGKLVRATAEGDPPPELLKPEPIAFR